MLSPTGAAILKWRGALVRGCKLGLLTCSCRLVCPPSPSTQRMGEKILMGCLICDLFTSLVSSLASLFFPRRLFGQVKQGQVKPGHIMILFLNGISLKKNILALKAGLKKVNLCLCGVFPSCYVLCCVLLCIIYMLWVVLCVRLYVMLYVVCCVLCVVCCILILNIIWAKPHIISIIFNYLK